MQKKVHNKKRLAALLLTLMLILTMLPLGAVKTQAAGGLTGIGLAEHAWTAYYENWEYVYGGNGGYGSNGRRQVDCSGFIYCYFTDHGVSAPGRTCTQLLNSAQEIGSIESLPRTHGVALYQDGHVGIYVGDGMAMDARDVGYDIRYQSVATKAWLGWFKVGNLSYPTTGWYNFMGDWYYYEDGEYVVSTTMTIDGESYTFGSDGRITGSAVPPSNPDTTDPTPEPTPAPTLVDVPDTVSYEAVTTDRLRLRYGPDSSYATITVTDVGETLTVLNDDNSSWYKVCRADGTEGFVSAAYLTVISEEPEETEEPEEEQKPAEEEASPAEKTAGVITEETMLRLGAGSGCSALCFLQPDTAVTVLDEAGDWLHVETESGSGYVERRCVRLNGAVTDKETDTERKQPDAVPPARAEKAAEQKETYRRLYLEEKSLGMAAEPAPQAAASEEPKNAVNDPVFPQTMHHAEEKPAAENSNASSVVLGFCIVMVVPAAYMLMRRLRRPRGEYVGHSAYSARHSGRR